MVLNFNIPNILHFNLGRDCLKNIGDSNLLLTINASNIKKPAEIISRLLEYAVYQMFFLTHRPSYMMLDILFTKFSIER